MREERADPQRDRAVITAMFALTLANAAVFLALGAGFVLDDWFALRNAEFDGALSAAGSAQGAARPGGAVVFALVFGGFGTHPLPGVLFLALVNGSTAALSYRLLRRFVGLELAALTALLWVVLPTHTATEVWASGSALAVSQLALVAGLLLCVRPGLGWVRIGLASSLLATSALTYEASLPMAAAGAVAVPWLANRRIDLRYLGAAGVACAVPAVWLLTHWYSGKSVHQLSDPMRVLQANLGWGITPDGPRSALATPLVLVALVGCAVAVARMIRRTWEAQDHDRLVVAGLVVMVIGFLPFARYFYEPQGAGDRANYLSSVGGAMVWAGLIVGLGRIRVRVAWVGLAGLAVLALSARHERLRVWSTAGQDAQAIADAVVAQIPTPDGTIVVGPEPIVRWNVSAYLDDSNLTGALGLAYGVRDVEVHIARDAASWAAAPARLRVELAPISRLDDLGVL